VSKKNVTIIRCDGAGCKEYVEWESTKVTIADRADATYPAGWYTIRQVDDNGKLSNSTFDFHSLNCISRWARGRKTAVGEPSSSVYAKKACPACGEMFAPQGFAVHWRTVHTDDMTYEDAKQLFTNS
jgi:hypothetical protein